MSSCEPQLLSAYLDGELSPQQAQHVELHVRDCPQCARELEQMLEASRAIAEYPFDELRPDELARLHKAIDERADQPVWRLGVILSGLAASILVISATWLAELPPRIPVVHSGFATTVQPENWEKLATTLRVSPLPLEAPDRSEIQVADAQFAQWMLSGLKN
jgi:anti-sigma factor RsiW